MANKHYFVIRIKGIDEPTEELKAKITKILGKQYKELRIEILTDRTFSDDQPNPPVVPVQKGKQKKKSAHGPVDAEALPDSNSETETAGTARKASTGAHVRKPSTKP